MTGVLWLVLILVVASFAPAVVGVGRVVCQIIKMRRRY